MVTLEKVTKEVTMAEILLGLIVLILLWRFGVLGNIAGVLGEELYITARRKEKAQEAKSFAREKYAGTRIIRVALRYYEDCGHRPSNFWYLSDPDRERYFMRAAQQLRDKPNSWGPFYKWVRRIQKLLYPVAWAIACINNNSKLSYEWHKRLFFLHHFLDWRHGNWNLVREKSAS